MLSRFSQVLFLDGDNVPIKDPTLLFSSPAFLQTGALFWKDFWKTHPSNPIWDILNIDCVDEHEQESGQLLINKSLPGVLESLSVALYMQTHSSLYFKLVLGDKDTFRLAFRKQKQPFHLVEPYLSPIGFKNSQGVFKGHTMLQYMPWDQTTTSQPIPIFLHSNLIKYTGLSNDHDVFTHVQRYKDKPVLWNGQAVYDGSTTSTRIESVNGGQVETVEISLVLNNTDLGYSMDHFEKEYRSLHKKFA